MPGSDKQISYRHYTAMQIPFLYDGGSFGRLRAERISASAPDRRERSTRGPPARRRSQSIAAKSFNVMMTAFTYSLLPSLLSAAHFFHAVCPDARSGQSALATEES
jgi:hypothetical protein